MAKPPEDFSWLIYNGPRPLPTATVARDAPIIPISAQLKYNIDAVNEYICTKIPVPNHNFDADARLIVIRSFDVNKPGATVDELKGGVAGGSILSGVFKVIEMVQVSSPANKTNPTLIDLAFRSVKRLRSVQERYLPIRRAASSASRFALGLSHYLRRETTSNSLFPED